MDIYILSFPRAALDLQDRKAIQASLASRVVLGQGDLMGQKVQKATLVPLVSLEILASRVPRASRENQGGLEKTERRVILDPLANLGSGENLGFRARQGRRFVWLKFLQESIEKDNSMTAIFRVNLVRLASKATPAYLGSRETEDHWDRLDLQVIDYALLLSVANKNPTT